MLETPYFLVFLEPHMLAQDPMLSTAETYHVFECLPCMPAAHSHVFSCSRYAYAAKSHVALVFFSACALDAAFLLTVGSFLLIMELFCLQLTIFSCFACNWQFLAFLLTVGALLLTLGAFLAHNGKVRLIKA